MTDQIRKWYYLIGALVASVVPILVTSGVVSDTQGNAWINAVVAIGGVLGVAGLGTAGVVLSKQIKNAPGAAADKAVTSLKEVQDQLNSTAQSAQDQLAAATKVAVDSINKIQATVGGVVGSSVSIDPRIAYIDQRSASANGPFSTTVGVEAPIGNRLSSVELGPLASQVIKSVTE